MGTYKIAGGLPENQTKIGKLNYLVMIFKRGDKLDFTTGFRGEKFLGFLNHKCQQIGQFFTGREKVHPSVRVIQLPHLFATKKIANETITQARKHDKGFNQKNRYKIVPIDISSV